MNEALVKALEVPSREQIQRLETAMLDMPQINLTTTHELSGGVYARTIFIPAGVTLTGAAHKKDHLNMMQGDITVWTEQGMKRLTGQHVIPTRAGCKRVGYAHADTTWTTICATDLLDVEAIEADLVEEPERLQTRAPAIGIDAVERLED